MAKINGIYQDKKTKTWYFYLSLGFDNSTGKRIQKLRRGFKTQREAYEARTKLLQEAQEMGEISNSDMTYKQFMDEIYIPDYETRVEETTLGSRLPALHAMRDHFAKKKTADISALEIQRWKNSLTKKYSQNYARLVYGMFTRTLQMAVTLNMVNQNRAKQVGGIPKERITVQFWSKEEFEKVLSTFDISDYYEHYSFVIVWLYFMTGLRVNEDTALVWDREEILTLKRNA